MVDAINYVANLNFSNLHFNKRLLKFFFLLAGYTDIDFKTNTELKFVTLCEITAKIALFNSGDAEKIKKLFIGYPDEIQEKYRNVFLLGRGSHSNAVTQAKIATLAEIIEFEISK